MVAKTIAIEVWCTYLDKNGKESEPVYRDIIFPDSTAVKRMMAKYGRVPSKIVIKGLEL